jgi:hypothetical protein
MAIKRSEFPAGWDETRVQELLDHYERQTDEEAAAEHEAALSRSGHTRIEIPTDLVPAVREIIAEEGRGHLSRFCAPSRHTESANPSAPAAGPRRGVNELRRAELSQLVFSGALLARGFWLYVWEIITDAGHKVLYVGMTGDTSSPKAQSPFNRVSQHLGSNKHSNALRRHLRKANIEPEVCKSFDLVAFGPILPETGKSQLHRTRRAKVAALEKALRDALENSGYCVLNEIPCRQRLDAQLWAQVLEAFSSRFPRLG